ncbi:MAG TPA: outer membrane beta-barrel protein [Gammaproteobacteria bacterium]|jgi:hypothetical protein
MKSIVIRLMLVLAALAVVPNALAADTSGGNIFVDAGVGRIFGKPLGSASGDSTGSQSGWGADGGYLWKLDDQRAFGLELGYMHFGEVANEYDNSGRTQLSASAMSLGANFQYLFGDDRAWVFQAHGGWTSVKFDNELDSFVDYSSGAGSQRQSGIYFGLGIGRMLTQDFGVLLAYRNYTTGYVSGTGRSLDLNWIGLVAEYQF